MVTKTVLHRVVALLGVVSMLLFCASCEQKMTTITYPNAEIFVLDMKP